PGLGLERGARTSEPPADRDEEQAQCKDDPQRQKEDRGKHGAGTLSCETRGWVDHLRLPDAKLITGGATARKSSASVSTGKCSVPVATAKSSVPVAPAVLRAGFRAACCSARPIRTCSSSI